MVIDKEKLISLLVDKTGWDRQHVEAQLSELVSRIQKAAEAGKSFEIEGFGTFSVENESLNFTPTDILKTEINNKYVGMKPIELIGAFKTPADSEIAGPVESTSGEAKEKAIDKAEAAVSGQEQEEEDFEADFNASKEAGPEPEENKESIEPQKEAGTKSEIQEETTPKATAPEEDVIGKFLTTAAAVLVIFVAGWTIYDMGFLGGSYTMNSETSLSTQDVEKSQIVSQEVSNAQDESGSDITQAGTNMTSEPDEPLEVIKDRDTSLQPEKQSLYGVGGEINSSVDTGYTIVVHSLKSLETASTKKGQLETEGFRVMITPASVNGTTYYRVGIGQFSTVQAAQQAVNKLPKQYHNNNFIKRF